MTGAYEDLQAAARRLRGVLIDTPVVGGIVLPGHRVPPGLRVKLECLQHGGSLWFRGAMHALALQLGAPRDAVATGGFRQVLASVFAATLQRIPVRALLAGAVTPEQRELLDAAGADAVEVVEGGLDAAHARAEELRRVRGAFVIPGPGDPLHDLGVATLGLELATQLGTDTDLVLVGPGDLAPAIAQGLATAERAIDVRAVHAGPEGGWEDLRRAVRVGLRVDADDEGLAALAAALGDRRSDAPCVVLGA